MINENYSKYRLKQGFSLVELILSLAILAVLTSTIIIVLSYMNKVTLVKGKKFDAVNYGQEAMEALLSLKDEDFIAIDPGSTPKTYYVSVNETSQTWDLTQVPDETTVPSENGMKRIVTLERVLANGTPTTPKIIKATITVKWNAINGMSDRISLEILLSSWSRNLNAVLQNSWCEVDVQTEVNRNIDGNQRARKIALNSNTVFTAMGLDLAVGSHALAKVVHTPPTLGAPTYGDGYITDSIATLGNYVFVSTDSNQEEVVIYDISSTPTKVGFFDATGCDCKSPVDIYARNVSGTKVVYLLMSDRLIIFNVTTIGGSTSQPKMSEYILPAKAKSLYIRSNFAFVGFADNDANLHMKILNISNLNNIQEIANAELDLGNTGVTEVKQIYSTPDTSRTYVMTNKITGVGQPELFLIDSSNKASMSVLDTYDSGTMDPNAFAVITADNIIIAGSVSNPASEDVLKVVEGVKDDNPTECFALTGTTYNTIYDMEFRNDTSGPTPSTYLYITTNDTNELKVLTSDFDVEGGGESSQIPIDRF
jgi:prepilin-type N-terminal cleavage/methylation domain-containing protein